MPAVSAISSQPTFNSHTSLSLNGGEHGKSDAVFTPKIWFVHDIVY